MDYKQAGVDIEKANFLINKVKSKIKETYRNEVISDIGGFAGFFDIVKDKYSDPVLVSSVDGVGTKLKLAFLSDSHSTIGIDLVAMCVNDIITNGAEPLFFLDYFATGKIDDETFTEVISGIVEGCKLANCALLGGETAEMPDFYPEGEYDLAGFVVGIVDKDKIIDGSTIRIGNKIIGLESSGVHSNGYSLVRKIFFENPDVDYTSPIEDLENPLIDELLIPTKIYVNPVLKLLKNYQINGMAHITGGGFIDNIPRILSEKLKAVIDCQSWQAPKIFKIIKNYGNVDELEMFKTFNNGIGYVLIVENKDVEDIIAFLNSMNVKSYEIGEIVERKGESPKIELMGYLNFFK